VIGADTSASLNRLGHFECRGGFFCGGANLGRLDQCEDERPLGGI
jgi:hypothetical protein